MMYKLSYGKTFNIGNFESERIDIQEEFPQETKREDALRLLKKQVEDLHKESQTVDRNAPLPW